MKQQTHVHRRNKEKEKERRNELKKRIINSRLIQYEVPDVNHV